MSTSAEPQGEGSKVVAAAGVVLGSTSVAAATSSCVVHANGSDYKQTDRILSNRIGL